MAKSPYIVSLTRLYSSPITLKLWMEMLGSSKIKSLAFLLWDWLALYDKNAELSSESSSFHLHWCSLNFYAHLLPITMCVCNHNTHSDPQFRFAYLCIDIHFLIWPLDKTCPMCNHPRKIRGETFSFLTHAKRMRNNAIFRPMWRKHQDWIEPYCLC